MWVLYVVGTLEDPIIIHLFNSVFLLLVFTFQGFVFDLRQVLMLLVEGALENARIPH